MITLAPAAVAIFAAAIFDSMPPLLNPETGPSAIRSISGVMARTSGMWRALRVALRIGGVEPVDVGEQHEAIGFHHRGDARAQPVVVAVADFGGRDRVVLVDHRNGVEREQRRQRFARVQIAPPLLGVFERQKNLRHREIVRAERIDIGLRQTDLSGRRRRLAFFQPQRRPISA